MYIEKDTSEEFYKGICGNYYRYESDESSESVYSDQDLQLSIERPRKGRHYKQISISYPTVSEGQSTVSIDRSVNDDINFFIDSNGDIKEVKEDTKEYKLNECNTNIIINKEVYDLPSNLNKVEILGTGIFGEVRKELDNEKGKEIAKKTINIQKIENLEEQKREELIEKIKKKIERMYKICQKKVQCNFNSYDGEAKDKDNMISIKMELCDCNIIQFLEKNKPNDKKLDIGEIYDVFSQLNKAFKTMKEENVIHGNIKLENILVNPDENEYLLSGFEIIPELVKYAKKQKLGDVYLYLPPELLEENIDFQIDEKTDIWSIGVIMYFLYFGEFPFPGQSCEEVLTAIKTNTRKRTEFRDLDNLIDGLLEEDKSKRLTLKKYLIHPFFTNNGFWKDYKKIQLIGNGEYSQVYKGMNKKSHKMNAIKIINFDKIPKLEEDSNMIDSIKLELKNRIKNMKIK